MKLYCPKRLKRNAGYIFGQTIDLKTHLSLPRRTWTLRPLVCFVTLMQSNSVNVRCSLRGRKWWEVGGSNVRFNITKLRQP